MKIQAIPIVPASDGANPALPTCEVQQDTGGPAEITMLKVSGPLDVSDPIVARARNLILQTGSKTMLESFDWAIKTDAVVAEK